MSVELSLGDLLAVWERGRGEDRVGRALVLWQAAASDHSEEELAAAPIGRRDHALLVLRIATFGPRAECFVQCPDCGEALEFEVDLPALVSAAPDVGDGPWELVESDWELRFRLPGSSDLREVARAPDPELLLRRCVLSATHEGRPADPASLPDSVRATLDSEMTRLDPQADVSLKLHCTTCERAWDAPFDIGAFLWREVEVAARRALWEIDTLARAYGWSEREILELGRARRRSYLEMMGAL